MMIVGATFLLQATVLSGCCEVTRADATLRIGTLDGPLETIFNQVYAIDIGSDGSLYVLEYSAGEIRVFSEAGEYVRTIGRRGDGPGELRRPGALGVREDTLWVHDGDAQKVELFTTDGLHATSLMFGGLTGPITLTGRFENGRFLVQRNYPYGTTGAQRVERPFLLVDLAARQVDTLHIGHTEHLSMKLTDVRGPNTGFVGMNPLARRDQTRVEPSGRFGVILDQTTVRGGSNERFDLVKVDADADVIWRKRYELRFTQDLEAVVEQVVENTVRTATLNMPDEIRQNFRERVYRDELREALLSVGDRAGLVEQILMDRDGRIWLKPAPAAVSNDTSTGEVWYVLDAEGEPIGIVSFPESMLRLLAVQGERAFGITLGEFDEQYVTTFTIDLELGGVRRP